MNKRNLLIAGGAAALSLALVALPGTAAKPQRALDSKIARLEQQIEELKAQRAVSGSIELQDADLMELQEPTVIDQGDVTVFMDGDGSSWLGVETREVTAEAAKDLKLPSERGVVLGKIIPDSPAAKAGLKENDVVTEINGQRVEGFMQFRRMLHEIPPGRTAQLSVWRDGHSQTVSVTLGKAEERKHSFKMATPGTFAFRMPDMPDIPEIPSMEWGGSMLLGGQPRLGIDAEDLSGQLGTFFGAPEGEGILVRDVNAGSAAEKAGVKAGDVITSLDGDRIRSVGELREKLSAKRDGKDKTVKLGVIRNKSALALTVELPAAPVKAKRTIARRTNI